MQVAIPPGENVRVHGKSQGYLGLPVHHFQYEAAKHAETLMECYVSVENVDLRIKLNALAEWLNKL